MNTVEQATQIVENAVQTLQPVCLPLMEALHLTLAEDIISGEAIPAFDNSAMDGYALRTADKGPRKVVAELRAGQSFSSVVQPGEAVRIMTGAPVPAGADAVLKFEDAVESSLGIEPGIPLRPGENIRRAGEDIPVGLRVLERGRFLKPAHLGVMASLGIPRCLVYPAPRVAILATGDEIIDIEMPLRPGQVRNSNSVILAGLVKSCGAVPVVLGVAPDQREILTEKMREGLECDVLITAGGVSMGDYDFVGDLAARFGEVLFTEVAQQPGKPFTFGILQGKPFFGLPGNPVSSMVTFELYVRPAIAKMMGRKFCRQIQEVLLLERIKQKPDRRQFLRAVVKDGDARLTGPQGSGVLQSMAQANALLVIPEGTGAVESGTVIEALPL